MECDNKSCLDGCSKLDRFLASQIQLVTEFSSQAYSTATFQQSVRYQHCERSLEFELLGGRISSHPIITHRCSISFGRTFPFSYFQSKMESAYVDAANSLKCKLWECEQGILRFQDRNFKGKVAFTFNPSVNPTSWSLSRD